MDAICAGPVDLPVGELAQLGEALETDGMNCDLVCLASLGKVRVSLLSFLRCLSC